MNVSQHTQSKLFLSCRRKFIFRVLETFLRCLPSRNNISVSVRLWRNRLPFPKVVARNSLHQVKEMMRVSDTMREPRDATSPVQFVNLDPETGKSDSVWTHNYGDE